MSIINNIIRGASTQFGREFGRAGANKILKGANHYTVKSDYDGRVKSSDSDIVRKIKEIKKLNFAVNDKTNALKLIELNIGVLEFIDFKGHETMVQIKDVLALTNAYNVKSELGNSLMSDDYKNNVLDNSQEKVSQAYETLNEEIKKYEELQEIQETKDAEQKKKNKKIKIIVGLIVISILIISLI